MATTTSSAAPTPPEPAAVVGLRPIFPAVVEAVHEGMKDYRAVAAAAAALGAPIPKRAMAPLLQGYIVARAVRAFSGDPRVRYEKARTSQEMFVVGEGEFAIVFKKSSHGLAQNHSSGAQDDLRFGGQADLGWGVMDWLVFLYEVDPAWTSITDVLLVSPRGYSENSLVHGVLAEVSGDVAALPLIPTIEVKPETVIKVEPKAESATKVKSRNPKKKGKKKSS